MIILYYQVALPLVGGMVVYSVLLETLPQHPQMAAIVGMALVTALFYTVAEWMPL
jgi:hypothetical protein